MAEIKSAVELAMEKTRDLRLSPEEKEKLKEEEMHSKAHSFVNRFLEVDFHLREVEKDLRKYNPEQRKQLEKFMLQYLAEAIHLDRENDLPLQGMEALREESKSITGKIRELAEGYRERKEKEYQKIKSDLLTKLQDLGISGSAVQPKVPGSPEWDNALAQFQPAFEAQLRILKEELKK